MKYKEKLTEERQKVLKIMNLPGFSAEYSDFVLKDIQDEMTKVKNYKERYYNFKAANEKRLSSTIKEENMYESKENTPTSDPLDFDTIQNKLIKTIKIDKAKPKDPKDIQAEIKIPKHENLWYNLDGIDNYSDRYMSDGVYVRKDGTIYSD